MSDNENLSNNNIFDAVQKAWDKYRQNLGDTRPWDILNPNTVWATEEEANKRYDICKACPELIQLTKQCKKCGCIMSKKTKLELANCPLGKW